MVMDFLRRLLSKKKGRKAPKEDKEETLDALIESLPEVHRNSAIIGAVNNGYTNKRRHLKVAFEYYRSDVENNAGTVRLAELAERMGDIETAAEIYIEGKMPIEAAGVYERHGCIDKAISLLRRDELEMMFGRFADSGFRYMKLAELFKKKGDPNEARIQHKLAVSYFIDSGHVHEIEEILAIYRDKQGLANAYEKLAEKEDINRHNFILSAARIHKELGNFARMQKLYFSYIEDVLDRSSKSISMSLILFTNNETLLECAVGVNEDDREKVVDLFERNGHISLAITFSEEYGMLERAVGLLSKMNDGKRLLYGAELCEELGDYKKASEFYERAHEHLKAAEAAHRAGDYKRTLEICARGVQKTLTTDDYYIALISLAINICKETGSNDLLERYMHNAMNRLSDLGRNGKFNKCAKLCLIIDDKKNADVYTALAELRTDN